MSLFGTDGVRGLANGELTPELALAVAGAAARVLASPAVAYLTASYGADVGVVLSASHNPMPDNGVKLFAAGGHKLPDDIEAEIEATVTRGSATERPTGASVGRVRPAADALARYGAHLLGAQPGRLDGLHVVVDCAHGAAAAVAPQIHRDAGAQVELIGADPDGLNINDGYGSTHLDALRAEVVRRGADLGIAHDGDADRCLAVDAAGSVVDGDQILALCALALRDAGTLKNDTIVATVMSNLGLHHAMRAAGIAVLTTAVGDRYVLEALRANDLSLGGEQSGHLVFTETATTGDGLLTALHVMARMVQTGASLAELAAVVRRLPQTLVNVRVQDRAAAVDSPRLRAAVAQAEAELGDAGAERIAAVAREG